MSKILTAEEAIRVSISENSANYIKDAVYDRIVDSSMRGGYSCKVIDLRISDSFRQELLGQGYRLTPTEGMVEWVSWG